MFALIVYLWPFSTSYGSRGCSPTIKMKKKKKKKYISKALNPSISDLHEAQMSKAEYMFR